MSVNVKTPLRPTPRFFIEESGFSTKKAREGTPRNAPPPRPPAKTCPPLSRVFRHKSVDRAKVVSFRDTSTGSDGTSASPSSPFYKTSSPETYFEQCFVVEKRLGIGSFGEVFKVKSKEDGKYYAVKRSRDLFKGEMDRKRKLVEVAKHELLPKHPNCVQFIRAWEERQHLYIQTELCDMSLSHFAENNHEIPEALIWNYLIDLLMAVEHLHNNDLVHMDIKPDNIFLVRDGACKLGDFGLILDLGKETNLPEAQEGDPKYLAPELLEGVFTKTADIFSLGVTIFEMASDLDLPRGGDGWHQLRQGCLPEEFLKGRISDELKNVIQRMMEPVHTLRPSATQLLQTSCICSRIQRRNARKCLKRKVLMCLTIITFFCSIVVRFWKIFTKLFTGDRKLPPEDQPSSPCDCSSPPVFESSFSDEDVFGADDEEDHQLVRAHAASRLSPTARFDKNAAMGASSLTDVTAATAVSSTTVIGASRFPRRAQSTGAIALRQTARVYFSGSPVKSPDHGASPLSLRSSSGAITSVELSSGASRGVFALCNGTPVLTAAGISATSSARKKLTAFHPTTSAHTEGEELKINLEPRNLLGMFESASHDMD